MPWALAGAALGALVAVALMRGTGRKESDRLAGPIAIRAPDISQLTPEERASRLFNRVMILAEAGKQDSVQFFLPMALGAYAQLPNLDADARYHLGLLQLAGGHVAAALAQADTMQRAVPNHLFIYILRAHAYEAQGNAGQEQRAYADFLRHEQAELALRRPEYDDHREALTNFHSEALRQAQKPERPTS